MAVGRCCHVPGDDSRPRPGDLEPPGRLPLRQRLAVRDRAPPPPSRRLRHRAARSRPALARRCHGQPASAARTSRPRPGLARQRPARRPGRTEPGRDVGGESRPDPGGEHPPRETGRGSAAPGRVEQHHRRGVDQAVDGAGVEPGNGAGLAVCPTTASAWYTDTHLATTDTPATAATVDHRMALPLVTMPPAAQAIRPGHGLAWHLRMERQRNTRAVYGRSPPVSPVPVHPALTCVYRTSRALACAVALRGDRSSKPVSGVPRRWRVRFPSASATCAFSGDTHGVPLHGREISRPVS